jgi:hypothetical protein
MFERRWIRQAEPTEASLLGTSDVQSLADLQTSVEAVRRLKLMPIDMRILIMFALGVAFPIATLLTLVMPVDELIRRALRPLL